MKHLLLLALVCASLAATAQKKDPPMKEYDWVIDPPGKDNRPDTLAYQLKGKTPVIVKDSAFAKLYISTVNQAMTMQRKLQLADAALQYVTVKGQVVDLEKFLAIIGQYNKIQ
ncbi:hypothetical protein [Flavihumibacter petaseus]|uniref:Uncharacterized protein n=1 Tax=Flavihumibacter petaseus NBRC 106054 TaxID=1220578 RepID=A0A0E9N1X9_9BACT|nr:hypothetical protein [Flavihumibacter petaseus]GAO43783.1 hypothetical protein FPE01S_02_08890 [Flavihumibacter petaseus NBRC 106054]